MPTCCPTSSARKANENGGDDFHGGDGPLHVSNGRSQVPLFKTFIDAGKQAGHPATDDFNGHQQEGFGPYQLTVKDGERWSAAAAYLKPALARPQSDGRSQRPYHARDVRGQTRDGRRIPAKGPNFIRFVRRAR